MKCLPSIDFVFTLVFALLLCLLCPTCFDFDFPLFYSSASSTDKFL